MAQIQDNLSQLSQRNIQKVEKTERFASFPACSEISSQTSPDSVSKEPVALDISKILKEVSQSFSEQRATTQPEENTPTRE